MNRLLPTAILFLAGAAAAQPLTSAFTYQGELRSAGNLASGPHDMRFRLYNALSGGAQQGPTLCADNVAVTSGGFSILLDFGAQFSGQQRFLEVEARQDTGLDCSNIAGFVLLAPRQELTAAPNAVFALAAANSSQLSGQPASFYTSAANLTGTLPSGLLSGGYSSPVNISNPANVFSGSGAALANLNAASVATGTLPDARLSANIPRLNAVNVFGNFSNSFLGSVGIGTSSPAVPLHVAAPVPVLVLQDSDSTATVQTGYVNLLNSAGTAMGYFGFGSEGPNPNLAIWNRRPNGAIQLGTEDQDRLFISSTGNVGVGTTVPRTTLHVNGQSAWLTGGNGGGLPTAAGAGLRLYFDGTRGQVFAFDYTTATPRNLILQDLPGAKVGIGTSSPTARLEVQEINTAVIGQSTGTSGTLRMGVWGRSNYVGVLGEGDEYGVWGNSNFGPTLFGVFSGGNLGASGTKSFRIDHPSDPENKYLLHYCAESNEVINFYSGKVTLDERGEAAVELPAYFAGINRDPRYTLTAIGAPMPLLHVGREVDEQSLVTGNAANPGDDIPACSFRIAGGAPGGRVSWEVKALRNDRWVQQRGAPVEVQKQPHEKGTYQHPDLYGQPDTMGTFGHRPAATTVGSSR